MIRDCIEEIRGAITDAILALQNFFLHLYCKIITYLISLTHKSIFIFLFLV